jgi:hypothetical protein
MKAEKLKETRRAEASSQDPSTKRCKSLYNDDIQMPPLLPSQSCEGKTSLIKPVSRSQNKNKTTTWKYNFNTADTELDQSPKSFH